MATPQYALEFTRPDHRHTPTLKALHFAYRAVRWMVGYQAIVDVTSRALSVRRYVLVCALYALGRAFAHSNRIEDASVRAHFRASITRQRNWLTAELRKVEKGYA